MTEPTLMERALALAVDNTEPVTTLSPPPAASAGTQAALRKCRAAWQRAFNEHMRNSEGTGVDEVFAARDAAQAGCPRSLAFGDLGKHEPQRATRVPQSLVPHSPPLHKIPPFRRTLNP